MKIKFYVFQKDVETLSIFPDLELSDTIDFGRKYKGQKLEAVILENLNWFIWALQIDTLPKFIIPTNYLIDFKTYSKRFKELEETNLEVISLKITLGEETEIFKRKLFWANFPDLKNTFWESFFLKYFYSFNVISKRFDDLFLKAYEKICNHKYNDQGYAGEVCINMLYKGYPEIGRILYDSGISSRLKVTNIGGKHKYQINKLKVYVGEWYNKSQAYNIVRLLSDIIDEVVVSYRSQNLIFVPRSIFKNANEALDPVDVSKPISSHEFLRGFQESNHSQTIDYSARFPNVNPREIECNWDNEIDSRDYSKDASQANREFYKEFGDSFHEDMMGNDR